MRDAARWLALLAAAWLGLLLAVAGLATPAAFAVLPQAEAGRVAARILAGEAYASLAFGALLLLVERVRSRREAARSSASQVGPGLVLVLGAVFCTVLGYFALQPMMAEARAGAGRFTFGQLHLASTAFYALKALLVAALAWRATRRASSSG